MKFSEQYKDGLTTKKREAVAGMLDDGMSTADIAKFLGKKESSVERMIRKIKEPVKIAAIKSSSSKAEKTLKHSDLEPLTYEGKSRVYFVTSVQNNADVNYKALKTVESYCKARNAHLLVGQVLYNHDQDESMDFDPRLNKYYVNRETMLGSDTKVLFDVNILATRKYPCRAVSTMTQGKNTIVMSARRQIIPIPSGVFEDTNHIFSSCTLSHPHYIQKTAGQDAEFHHVYGGLIVEVDSDGTCFHRHVTINSDGSFYDLGVKYDGGKSEHVGCLDAVLGDSHAPNHDVEITSKIKSILRGMNCEDVSLHDVYDAEMVSPHVYTTGALRHKMSGGVADEYNKAMAYVKDMAGHFAINLIPSNHNNMLDRWIFKQDWKRLPADDMQFYLKMSELALGSTSSLDLFDQDCAANIFDLSAYERHIPIMTGKYQNVHGDCGINGARGINPSTANKIGCHIIHGHTHNVQWIDGVLSIGHTSNMGHGYNERGWSTWQRGFSVRYADDHVQMLIARGNKFYLED